MEMKTRGVAGVRQPSAITGALCACRQFFEEELRGDAHERLKQLRQVCEECRRRSCFAWLVTHPDARVDDEACRISLPVGEGRFTEAVHPTTWPVPIRDSNHNVEFVIRQWVEERPQPKLLKSLDRLPAWKQTVARVQGELVFQDGGPEYETLYDGLRRTLIQYGLPATPGTVDYLMYCVAPQLLDPFGDAAERAPAAASGPTRGILVRSFGLEPRSLSATDHHDVVCEISFQPAWTIVEHRRSAVEVAGAHAEWVKDIRRRQIPQVDCRHGNGRKPDEMTADVERQIQGLLSPRDVVERAVEREKAGYPFKWSDHHTILVKHKARQRMYRRRQRQDANQD